MPEPGESVREQLSREATEKALSLAVPDHQLTDEERAAKDEQRRAFWRSVGKRRRRAWK